MWWLNINWIKNKKNILLKLDPITARMIKGGVIYQHASGIYTINYLGMLIINKINGIIRDEMNKIGALEVFFPILQAQDVWRSSNRIDAYKEEKFKIKDTDYILAPTSEDIIYNKKNKI